MSEAEEALFKMQDEFAKWIASLTGLKAQLIDSGWSEASAELMVIEMFRTARGQAQ